MSKEVKMKDIVSSLIDLTREGELQWKKEHPPSSLTFDKDIKVDTVYLASYRGRRLRLYESNYRNFDPDIGFYWDNKVNLELVDESGTLEWQFPYSLDFWELLEAVRYQTADVEGFLELFKDTN